MIFLSAFTISIAVMNLFYGVVWLFHTWKLREAAHVTARVSAVIVPAMLFLFTEASGLDVITVVTGEHKAGVAVARTMLPMLVFIMLFGFVAPRLRLFAPVISALSKDVAVRGTAYVSMCVAVLAAFTSSIISSLDVNFAFPVPLVYAIMLFRAVVLCAFILVIVAVEERRAEPGPEAFPEEEQ